MTARDMSDRVLRDFLRTEIGQFPPHFGVISLLTYTGDLENNKEKSTGEDRKKNPVDKNPQNCRFFLSLVVVKRVLSKHDLFGRSSLT